MSFLNFNITSNLLKFSIKKKHPRVALFILKFINTVHDDYINSTQKPLISHAIETNNIALIENLIKKNINFINITDQNGNTPLHQAILLKSPEIAKCLIHHIFEKTTPEIALSAINRKNIASNHEVDEITGEFLHAETIGQTPLELCITHDLQDVGTLLVEKIRLHCSATDEFEIQDFIEKRNHFGSTPLIHSTVANRIKMVQCLLEDADINAVNPTTESTALDLAIGYDHRSICKLLIDHGASLENNQLTGMQLIHTPLGRAIHSQNNLIIEYLLNAGVDPSVNDCFYVLYTCMQDHHKKSMILKQLFKSKPNMFDMDTFTRSIAWINMRLDINDHALSDEYPISILETIIKHTLKYQRTLINNSFAEDKKGISKLLYSYYLFCEIVRSDQKFFEGNAKIVHEFTPNLTMFFLGKEARNIPFHQFLGRIEDEKGNDLFLESLVRNEFYQVNSTLETKTIKNMIIKNLQHILFYSDDTYFAKKVRLSLDKLEHKFPKNWIGERLIEPLKRFNHNITLGSMFNADAGRNVLSYLDVKDRVKLSEEVAKEVTCNPVRNN